MPYRYYYGIDMYYIVLVLLCVLFYLWAQSKVNSTFEPATRGCKIWDWRTGGGEAVLRYNGVSGVRIEYVSGKLTDHFDPRSNVIRLSSAVYCPRRWRLSALPRTRQGMRCSTPSAMRRSSCARRSC